jgi:hypothetical protein
MRGKAGYPRKHYVPDSERERERGREGEQFDEVREDKGKGGIRRDGRRRRKKEKERRREREHDVGESCWPIRNANIGAPGTRNTSTPCRCLAFRLSASSSAYPRGGPRLPNVPRTTPAVRKVARSETREICQIFVRNRARFDLARFQAPLASLISFLVSEHDSKIRTRSRMRSLIDFIGTERPTRPGCK